MSHVDRRDGQYQWAAAFLLYLAFSVLTFGRGLAGHLTTAYIGRETDPSVHMWFFNWWRFAIAHSLNPFITDWVWAPPGINLAWTTCVPLPSLVSIPLQATVGEPATYNIIVMLMLPLAALAAFLLCQHVTGGAFWPSVLGGYIFGFSPHMLGEVLGHLVVIAVFPVPLIALIALDRLEYKISAARFSMMLALLLVTEFLCSVDLFATMTLVGGFSLLLDELPGGNSAIRMLAEIDRRRQRIVEAELLVDRLRDLIPRENLVSGAIGAGRQTDYEQKDRPIPIENLGAQNQQQDCAAQSERCGKGSLMEEQMAHLSHPGSPD